MPAAQAVAVRLAAQCAGPAPGAPARNGAHGGGHAGYCNKQVDISQLLRASLATASHHWQILALWGWEKSHTMPLGTATIETSG